MKRLNRNLSVLIACAFLCLIPLTRIAGFAEEPERIPPLELKRLIDSGEKVVVVDVRSEQAYREAHIPRCDLYSAGAAWHSARRTSQGRVNRVLLKLTRGSDKCPCGTIVNGSVRVCA